MRKLSEKQGDMQTLFLQIQKKKKWNNHPTTCTQVLQYGIFDARGCNMYASTATLKYVTTMTNTVSYASGVIDANSCTPRD